MNKTAIKNFAVWARRKLITDIQYKAGMLGITENGIAEALPQSTKDLKFFDVGTKNYTEIAGNEIKQRDALVAAIKAKERDFKNYKEAFEFIVEEVAYTWFNRLIAIRFMEVNEYLPSGVRVLSSENKAKVEPDFVTSPFDTDLEFTPYEQDRVIQLKDENKLDELFRMLFIKQCNKLNAILPQLFEKTDDFTELLLTISFTDKDGVVYKLTHDIDEDDFNITKEGQVEIIGWMYQYYNIEPKATVFARASGTKIKKEDIPAATQLFTPDWIVRYMVENSLGRMWVEGHPNDNLKNEWNYYIDEAEQEADVEAKLEEIRSSYKELTPEQIKVIDPCMGSGHILVYAFDVLMQIYENCGYTQRDAARSILQNNIFGLDIDNRAYQLAYFAVMMKARQYNRRILTEGIEPNLDFIQSAKMLDDSVINRMGDYKKQTKQLLEEFRYAAEYGSVLNVSISLSDLEAMEQHLIEVTNSKNIENLMDIMECDELVSVLSKALKQAKMLTQKYEIVVTNPPYLGGSAVGAKLNDYLKLNYPTTKTDLFAVFIERCKEMLNRNGYQAMITMHSWMFLSSYEKLRDKLQCSTIISMAHLGARGFEEIAGEVVQTTAFVLGKSNIKKYKGTYCRLLEPNSQQAKEAMFLSKENRYFIDQANFQKIPGSPIAYWVSDAFVKAFDIGVNISKYIDSFQGIITGDNNKFLRLWHELDMNTIAIDKDNMREVNLSKSYWIPYNKGGEFRKWYGNQDYVVNWKNGPNDKTRGKKTFENYYLREYVSWSYIASTTLATRYFPCGFLWDVSGSGIFDKKDMLFYLQGLIGSVVGIHYLQVINPTINYQVENILQLPIILNDDLKYTIDTLVKENVALSKEDWDSFENSWNFKEHPLVRLRSVISDATAVSATMNYYYGSQQKVSCPLELCFKLWQGECEERYRKIKENEQEINRLFIEIYGLQNELKPVVCDKDITVRKADLERDIKSLISYAVGCMLGRYSLSYKGLAYAGGKWEPENYLSFTPDKDNCIPITDEEYFEDDIVGLFCDWLKKVFGKENLEANLDFIAKALGHKGTTNREVLRNYFLNDFFKEHCKTYSVIGSGNRPIYWLFDSGKENGFKALCYMHRWNVDTIGNMRVEYLHRMQKVYEKEIERMQEIIDNSRDNKEISYASKRKEKLQKQIKETKDYDAKVAHLALARINIDLDDGVKTNYNKVQTSPDGKKMQILSKI